jgi:hypothetical protein
MSMDETKAHYANMSHSPFECHLAYQGTDGEEAERERAGTNCEGEIAVGSVPTAVTFHFADGLLFSLDGKFEQSGFDAVRQHSSRSSRHPKVKTAVVGKAARVERGCRARATMQLWMVCGG